MTPQNQAALSAAIIGFAAAVYALLLGRQRGFRRIRRVFAVSVIVAVIALLYLFVNRGG